jgi:signal transduction histidine kinase
MEVSEGAGILELDSERRRHILLFFKEAIHNAARHANARSVLLQITVDHRTVRCRVTDDGSGFDVDTTPAAAAARGSRGLANMSARASQLGGQLQMRSTPGEGTVLTMTVPLGRFRTGRMNMRWLTRRRADYN